LDGSNAVEVKVDPYLSYDWVWSPDSSALVFSVPNGRGRLGTDLWMVNADGSNLRRVTVTEREDAMCMEPTWSPDSRVIAYTYRANTVSQPESVWVVNADGTNPHLLVDLAFDPQWSVQGNQIAVLRLRSLTDNPETSLVQVDLGQH
jgi:Tol biopolymer transport system component